MVIGRVKILCSSSGLVTDAYDAQGVDTSFSYDDLNRITQIEYLKPSGGSEVAEGTPTAHYDYDLQTLPSGAPSTSSPASYTRAYTLSRYAIVCLRNCSQELLLIILSCATTCLRSIEAASRR